MHARFWVLSLIEAIKKAPQSPCIRFANDALYLLWFVDDGDAIMPVRKVLQCLTNFGLRTGSVGVA